MGWEAVGVTGGVVAAFCIPGLACLARVAWLLGEMKNELKNIETAVAANTLAASNEHTRIWEKLGDHDSRISVLESK